MILASFAKPFCPFILLYAKIVKISLRKHDGYLKAVRICLSSRFISRSLRQRFTQRNFVITAFLNFIHGVRKAVADSTMLFHQVAMFPLMTDKQNQMQLILENKKTELQMYVGDRC